MRFSSPLLRGLAPASLFAISLCAPALAAEAPQARLFGSYPAESHPVALTAGKDGYLYGVFDGSVTNGANGGVVYRVTPDGDLRVLHTFPWQTSIPTPNIGGSLPDRNFTVADDGCLYGFTASGGAWGHGIFYSVTPAGAFSVVFDLTQDFYRYGLIEGRDHQFYINDGAGGIYRVGAEGNTRIVYGAGGNILPVEYPAEPQTFLFSLFFQGFPSETLKQIDPVTGTSTNLLDGLYLGGDTSYDQVKGVAWNTDAGCILVMRLSTPAQGSATDQVLAVNGSQITVLATLGTGAGMAPEMVSFLSAATDGTIYYLTGISNTPWGSGSTVIALKPDGSHHVVCGFGDKSCAGFVRGPQGSYYSLTPSDTLYLPRSGTMTYSADWMAPANAANYRVQKGKRNKGTFFQIAPEGGALDAAPLTPPLLLALGKKSSLAVPFAPAIRDPEKTPYEILGADSSSGSIASVAETANGRRLRFLYTPAEGSRSSDIAHYYASAPAANSSYSTGTILVRGEVAGKYIDPLQPSPQGGSGKQKPLTFSVQPNGRFSVLLPAANGKAVAVAGMLDYRDHGSAAGKVPGTTGDYVSVTLSIQGDELSYSIRRTGAPQATGTATRGE